LSNVMNSEKAGHLFTKRVDTFSAERSVLRDLDEIHGRQSFLKSLEPQPVEQFPPFYRPRSQGLDLVLTLKQVPFQLKYLTLSLLMPYIYGAPSKARNLTYIYMDEIFTRDFAA
jgi:hypothetical protein